MASPPKPGEPAPPIDLPSLQGERFQLADRQGRAVVVTFLRHAG
jgi:peroxiredoxin